ncbi:MAG TPA: D-alanyl-D-alanine carboxypeptidase/D-alanyl-D-alanine-endopeptidase [Candidatus Baltobacteraceae bacterium]
MNVRALSASLTLFWLVGCGFTAAGSDSQPVAVAHAEPAQQVVRTNWSPSDLARVHSILESSLVSQYFAHAGVAVADESGRLLYGRNVDHGYAPASTLKVLVAATSLATLGVDARLDTSLASLNDPDTEGRIDDLWLVGGGDPTLDLVALQSGVASLYKKGVRRVDGDVIVDATSFTAPEQNMAWAPDDFEYGYAAGTSAISLNWNVIEFKVLPTRVGEPARVTVFPADPSIIVHGTPMTGYNTTLTIDRVKQGRNEFNIRGSIAYGWEQSYFRPVDGIPLWAAQVVAQMLHDQHIMFDGRARLGTDPIAVQTLWEHRSPPLHTMIKQMLFESDNHIAETLLRVLGTTGGDGLMITGGSEAAGARTERAFLHARDVPTPALQIVDGSGLAERDRIAPITIVRLLQVADHLPIAHEYVSAFPRAGIEGTVRHHDLGPALGRVHAKSGHIDGVNSLVGYVDTRHHGRLAFAFLVNAPYADDATSIQVGIDRALDELVSL